MHIKPGSVRLNCLEKGRLPFVFIIKSPVASMRKRFNTYYTLSMGALRLWSLGKWSYLTSARSGIEPVSGGRLGLVFCI